MESTSAILIRKTRFSESSLIVTWLGKDSGKIKTAARSALKSNSKFAGKTDLFYEAEIHYTLPKKGDVCQLQDVVVHHRFQSGANYPAMVMCSYFAELTDIVTEFFHPVPGVHDLFRRALVYLETSPPDRRALHHFEDELCRQLGIFDARAPANTRHLLLFEYGGRRLPLRNTLLDILRKNEPSAAVRDCEKG